SFTNVAKLSAVSRSSSTIATLRERAEPSKLSNRPPPVQARMTSAGGGPVAVATTVSKLTLASSRIGMSDSVSKIRCSRFRSRRRAGEDLLGRRQGAVKGNHQRLATQYNGHGPGHAAGKFLLERARDPGDFVRDVRVWFVHN